MSFLLFKLEHDEQIENRCKNRTLLIKYKHIALNDMLNDGGRLLDLEI